MIGLSLISHIYIPGVQIRTIGHTGEGTCICARDEDGDLEIDDACPVRGHSGAVTRVHFSDDGLQVISGSKDGTVLVSPILPANPVWVSLSAPRALLLCSHRSSLPTGALLGRGFWPASATGFRQRLRFCRGRCFQAPGGPTHPHSEQRYAAYLRVRRGGEFRVGRGVLQGAAADYLGTVQRLEYLRGL